MRRHEFVCLPHPPIQLQHSSELSVCHALKHKGHRQLPKMVTDGKTFVCGPAEVSPYTDARHKHDMLQLQIMVLGALRSTQPKAANLVEKLSLALALPMVAITQLVTLLLDVHKFISMGKTTC